MRNGKVSFGSLSFPFHSQFPAASKKDPTIFPSVGELSIFPHNMFDKQSFNTNTFSIYAVRRASYLSCHKADGSCGHGG